MEILEFTPELAADWDAFVSTHPLASYGHLPVQRALAGVTGGMRDVSIAVHDGRQIVGILPLFLTEHHALRRVTVRELSSGAFFPAGPIISPKQQGKAEARILELLLGGARARGAALKADRITITHPNVIAGQPSIVRCAYSPLLHHGFRPRAGVGMLLDLSQSPEQLAAGRKSGCRQSITKAQAAGVTIEPLTERTDWLACHELNLQTLGDLAFSPAQMRAIWDGAIARGFARAWGAHYQGSLAAVVVTIEWNGSSYYWIGLNRRPTPIPGAGHVALWSAILAARDAGARYFELGSLDFENPKNVGISQFKQSFGGLPYQIVSAQADLRPVKGAAIALGEALLAELRARRKPAAATKPAAGHPSTANTPRADDAPESRKVATQPASVV